MDGLTHPQNDPNVQIETPIEIVPSSEQQSPIQIEQEPRKNKHTAENRIATLVWEKNEEKRRAEAERQKNLELEQRIKALESSSVQKETQEKLALLNQKKVEAIEIGDGQAIVALDSQIFSIMAQNPGVTPPVPVQNPSVQTSAFNADAYFGAKYPWYLPGSPSYNPSMVSYSAQVDVALRNDPNWASQPIEIRLDEVARRVMGAFPQQQAPVAPSGYVPVQSQFAGIGMVEPSSQFRPATTSQQSIQMTEEEYKFIKGTNPHLKTDSEIRDHYLKLQALEA